MTGSDRGPGQAGRLQRWVASGLGIGHAPVAPGTFGSLPGVLLVFLLAPLGGPIVLLAITLVIALGWWSAGPAARYAGREDPGHVVVDEIAGQMLTLWNHPADPGTLIAGFVLFRLFDIWKPFPARRMEKLHGSSGIMLDDLVAGVYASLVLYLFRWAWPAG